jgi:hypothetical protein
VTNVGALLRDRERRLRMRAAALAFHAAHRGAGDRLWAWLAPQLAPVLRSDAELESRGPVSEAGG